MKRFPNRLVLALAAAMLGMQINLASPTNSKQQAIFIAATDVAAGDVLTAVALRIEEWPADNFPEGAISHLEDIEGRRLRTDLYTGEPILEQKLFPRGAEGMTPAQRIPVGYRAVSINVHFPGYAEMVVPGDRVDVLAYVPGNPTDTNSRPSVRILLQDIKVLAVNHVFDPTSAIVQTHSSDATMILLVTPKQGQHVTLAAELGKIGLMLRNPEDSHSVDAEPVEWTGNGSPDGLERAASDGTGVEPEPEKIDSFFEFLRRDAQRATGNEEQE
jgi:pilus assembly protein CpaB